MLQEQRDGDDRTAVPLHTQNDNNLYVAHQQQQHHQEHAHQHQRDAGHQHNTTRIRGINTVSENQKLFYKKSLLFFQ